MTINQGDKAWLEVVEVGAAVCVARRKVASARQPAAVARRKPLTSTAKASCAAAALAADLQLMWGR